MPGNLWGIICKHDLSTSSSTAMDVTEDAAKNRADSTCKDGGEDGRTEAQNVKTGVQSERYVYRQDVVRCINRKDLLGVVVEVPGDSDSDGSVTDDSDIEDGANDDSAYGRHGNKVKDDGYDGDETREEGDPGDQKDPLSDSEVRVMWLDGTETTDNLSDLVVVQRGFLHGDIVASAENPSGQLGLVVDVNITVDLLSPTGKLIKNVPSSELTRIREFAVGDYVIQGPWLGRVEDVLDNVTVLFDDGSACKVLKAEPLRLKPVAKSIVDDSGFPYYPGQRVRASSSSVFKNCRFISGSWKANRLEGTVTKVEAGSVYVYWTSSSSLGTGANPETVPAEQQNPKNLTLVSCFAHANWQLGDWCLFPPHPAKFSSYENASNLALDCPIGKCNVNDGKSTNLVVDLNEEDVDRAANMMVHNLDIHDQDTGDNARLGLNQRDENGGVDLRNSGRMACLDSLTVVDCSTYSLTEDSSNQTEMSKCASSVQKEPIRESRPVHRKKMRKVVVKREHKGSRKDDSFEKAFLIINIITKVNVVWQDGTRQHGLNSASLNPINNPGEQDFFPEQYVIEKVSSESDDSSEIKRVGVVRSVNSSQRTACVRWLKPVQRPEDLRQFDTEEVVSAYELDEHPDYDYCYGDVVIRLAPIVRSSGDVFSENSFEEGKDHIIQNEENDLSAIGCELNMEAKPNDQTETAMDLSWVGHITGLQDGDIEVTWADGMISKVGPQAIFVVGRDDDETFDGGSEYSNGASWETVEENDMDGLDTAGESDLGTQTDVTAEKEDETSEKEKEENNGVAGNGPLLSAFDYFTRLASGIFSRGKNQADSTESEKEENKEHATELDNPICDNSGYLLGGQGSHVCCSTIIHQHNLASETIGAEVIMPHSFQDHVPDESCPEWAQSSGDVFAFKHFDITKDPLDHYFLGRAGQAAGEKRWVKKVQKEWSILEKNLPDAIYVRVFEDRMDLLRVAIIGACGTPYQDGLFFFDFQLPPEYPQGPPKAYYHSGGLRVNPNLYEDGKVCLSLLNTWTGKGNEVWEPTSSSVLQVLVSIQGLVLNSKPYFNEAGYEKHIGTLEGEKNSLPYNENTFLLNLKSMMYVLRRPPMHFEEFSKAHFRRRGHYILKACDTYMKGTVVGSLTKDADVTEESNKHSCSLGFRLMLAKILPRLFAALSEVGAECKQFEHLSVSSS